MVLYISVSIIVIIVIDVITDKLIYQSELYTIHFSVDDIKDEDEILFMPFSQERIDNTIDDTNLLASCDTTTGNPYKQYSFEYGRFPQVYISNSHLFENKLADSAFVRLLLCFRPKSKQDSGMLYVLY